MTAVQRIPAKYADIGFNLQPSDGGIEVCLKDNRIKVLPQQATDIDIAQVCEDFLEIDRLLHKAEVECGLDDIDHRKLNRLIAEQEGSPQ